MRIEVNFLYHSISFLKEKIGSLTPQQKKIVTIALFALSFLSACILALRQYCCFIKARPLSEPTFQVEKEAKNKEAEMTVEDLTEEILDKIYEELHSNEMGENKSSTSSYLNRVIKSPEIIPILLKEGFIPTEKKIEFVKLAGPHLQTLNLDQSHQVSDQILKEILIECPNILRLKIEGVENFTGSALAHLSENTEYLELVDCPNLIDTGLAKLSPKLKELYLIGCKNLTDQVIGYIPLKIKGVDLSFCEKLTEKGLKSLRLLQNLEYLNLSGYSFSGETLPSLPSNLKELNLSKWKNLKDEFIGELPVELECLDLGDCIGLTDTVIEYLSSYNNLNYLNLKGCKLEQPNLGNLPSGLRELDLSNCVDLKDQAFSELNLLDELECLNLDNCLITDDALAHLPVSLEELSVRGCESLTEQARVHLKRLENLKSLKAEYTALEEDNSIIEEMSGS